jgi:SAM-dependent methyltransferase
VLEPACGSGRLVLEMSRRSYAVTGFDANERMLAYARERMRARGLRARLAEARLESFELGTDFDSRHCLVSTFQVRPRRRRRAQSPGCIARALRRAASTFSASH